MDPITLILTALSAALLSGATAGAKDAASSAIKDGYAALKDLLQRKLAGKPEAQYTLSKYEEDPDTYEKPMKKTLIDAGIDPAQDQHLIDAANNLLKLVQQANVATNQIINQGPVENQVGFNYGSVNIGGRSSKGEQ